MRGLLLAIVVTLGSTLLPPGAQAQSGPPRLERAGWGFGCVENPKQFAHNNKTGLSADMACGQVGPLALGMPRGDAEKVLGSPATTRSLGTNVFYVYALQTDETKHMITSAVLAYDAAGRVRSIQITGAPWPGAWSFADIHLGDPDKTVAGRLGQPHNASTSDVPGTLVWDYLPWTFSFEIRGAHVSSIRVSE